MCLFFSFSRARATSELLPKRRGERRNTFWPSARSLTSCLISEVRLTKLASSTISPQTKGFSMEVITLISVTPNGVIQRGASGPGPNWCLPARQAPPRFRPVDGVNLAAEIRRIIGGEKRKQGRYFFRRGMAAQRKLAIHFFQHSVSVFGGLPVR